MLKLARWSTTHRKYVVIGWIVLLVAVNVLAQQAGTSYSNNFTLPNSDAQRASDLLQRSFPQQAGDRDTIVYKVSSGSVRDPAVRARMRAMLERVARLPARRERRRAPTAAPPGAAPSPATAGSRSPPSCSTKRRTCCRRRPANGSCAPPARPRSRACRSSSAGRRSSRPSRAASASPRRSA